MTLAIETHQLTRYFNNFCAVSGIDLAVERGTFYGFLGPNGAGKSTSMKIVDGTARRFRRADEWCWGAICSTPREALEAKRRMGVIPEDLALFDNLTAREYLTFVGRIHLMPRDTIRSRSNELLSLLDLQDEEKKLTLEYSHGMKKKLAMAAALLPNPDLLFLDEPFEGVDAVTSRVIRDLLAGFVARGSTVLLDFARFGNRRAALHARGHHRQREAGRTGLARRDSPGGLARGLFSTKGRGRARCLTQAQLARGGGIVNWQHFQAFSWLRWRLLKNRWRRAGAVNAVLMMIVSVAAIITAIPLLIGSFILGIYMIPDATPIQLMYAADVVIVAFLFFWGIGLVTELQRTEPLSLSKFMHLPVSVNGAFLINYISSLMRLSLLIFGPAMLGFSLALVWTKGILLVPVLPGLAAFLLLVSALTYQLQGWLASLMSNPRRRRTVIVATTMIFVLGVQLPNLINIYAPIKAQQRAGRSKAFMEEMARLDRETRAREFDAAELVRRQQEAIERHKLADREADRVIMDQLNQKLRLANMVLPVGWLPLGITAAAEGHVMSHSFWEYWE